MKTEVNLKLFEENWSFENYLKIEVMKIKFEDWNFERLFENGNFWNFEIWKNIWKWNFWKLNLKIGILKKILENGSFEN